MSPATAYGLLWVVIALVYLWWLSDAVAAWRRGKRRGRLAILAFTGTWALTAGDRAALWLGWGPGRLGDWGAAAVLALAAAATVWVAAEFHTGRIVPPRTHEEG